MRLTRTDDRGRLRDVEATLTLSRPVAVPASAPANGYAPVDGDDVPGGSLAVAAGIANCRISPCGRLVARVILDGDAYFDAREPSTCHARLVRRFEEAVGPFDAADIRFLVTQVNCRDAADLGGPGTTPQTYLERARAAWSGIGSDRSVVHVAAGFDFGSGQPVGIAYRPGVCVRYEPDPGDDLPPAQRCSNGISVWQAASRPGVYDASGVHAAVLTAHELGHAFSARHEDGSGCSRSRPRTGTIMCEPLQFDGPVRFSAAAVQAIRSHAEATIGALVRVP